MDGCVRDEDEVLCEGCPLLGTDFKEWIAATSDPLYRAASKWLLDHELGLTQFWGEPDGLTIEAIRFVYAERNALDVRLRKHTEGQG